MKGATTFAMLVPLALAPAGQQPEFRSSVALVRLEVSVSDARGPVAGLSSGDFVVSDGGHRQSIRIEEAADAPLDLVLVAHPISSVAYTSAEQAPRLAAALTAFLAQVQDRDRLGAVVAGAPPRRLRPLDFGRPAFTFEAFGHGTYAAPFDAIAAALREFVDTDRRRALIAITNGVDGRSTVSLAALAEMARRLGPAFVLVSSPVRIQDQVSVGASTASGQPIGDRVVGEVSGYVFPASLQVLARRTGGITVNVGAGDPTKLIAEMFTWLRTRYLISYSPPAGKGWHPVTVKVNRRGANVTARDGYFID